ncbi:MAG: AAA family ATPase [Nostoc sp. NMS1]|uniref:trifunctional serine/threonine-protein kinase/ATP-binding protein/sensor histidine kinase n=1 Tax=unclassified Nostoc TaxID=2593658 RepID=UPI0025E313C0|nr:MULTISPECIES: trifunctional serine/threonine-protein kinase/ATP-binding protein/sensor histidine kinase [unclassified Nostoc]MBN3906992.1 AAA family ATPase [Nostoc sp. NMS1]MBN3992036.1 AAA family ATPase [Nostoc sp. NMS2]
MSAKVDGTVRIAGYQIIEQLYSGSRTQVYRAERECDRQPVVIKLLKREYPSFSELVQFRNQYAIAKNLDISSIIKPYSLEPHHNGYALVMEDFGGISLRQFTQRRPLNLEEFLPIALHLIDTLHQLHQQRVIHKDIKPANILIHPETRKIKLIDFSIASLLPRETQEIQSPNGLEGTLAYLSPEQTGRMNRGIDYRSDFYSLGVTFFELLSGQLPFTSHNPMELLHCHIAKQPDSICNLNSEIPLMLGEIVCKLMAKNAEDRYQSATGLKYDLVFCLEQWRETGKHTWFDLGQRDISDRFLIREKLYGREQEIESLLEVFGRVANGAVEMMLVAGFSGIGKTAVVNEVHKVIVRWNGYFIKGKYDQFNHNIPLSAFVQAFRDLMGQLLTESDTQLEQWRNKILSAISESGQVIIEVIPELERIIGTQPPVPKLSGSAAQNRFNLLFVKFIQVFATREHPLVVFLDDLQWVDLASLNLMRLLMGETLKGYLLIIGAYRDNEVFAAHPLMVALEEIEKGVTVSTITLAPLSQTDVNRLIADTLSYSTEVAQPLTELVYQKAKGNPFFTTQFLKALYEDGRITFDWDTGFWHCDVVQAPRRTAACLQKSLSLMDDVVEFMAIQLQKLPLETQEVLKLAACIGNQFDLATLAIAFEQSQTQTAAVLWKALQEGLILPHCDVYKFYQESEESVIASDLGILDSSFCVYTFLHDRVQQAAYSLIPEEQKQATHLKIGQLLLSNIPESNREERIFEIVSQLNVAAELIAQPAERQALAQFNLMASRKAKAAIAYTAACKYAQVGIGLLAQNSWEHQYELTLALHQVATETAYLSGDLEEMAANAHLVLNHAKTPLDKISVYEVKIEVLTAQGQFAEAIAAALAILKQLGVELPALPTQDDVATAFSTVLDVIGERLPAELLNLSEARDANILAAARILTSVAPCAYLYQPLLYLLVILKKVYLSVVYGNESTSSFSYVSYGILMCGVFQNVELGYEFGQLALDLRSRYQNSELKGKTLLLVYLYTRHWKIHLRELLQPLQTAYCSCLDVGDLAFAGYSAFNYGFYSYFAGQNLTQLEPEVASYCEALKHLKQNLTLNYSQLIRQILLNLMGDADNVVVLSGTAYNEQHQLPLHEAAGDRTGLALLWINKLVLSYLFSEFEQAVEQAGQARQYLDAILAFLYVPIFHFYDSLAQLALFEQLSALEQQQMKEYITANQEKLNYWAAHAPMNFRHKFDLVEAERYRVLGNRAEAIECYDRAIIGAKEQGYIQEEALANELAAKFYLDWGKEQIAQSYMTQAYYGYARWGAKAKVVDLEKRYPQLLAPILQQKTSPLSTNETIFALGSVTSTSSVNSSSSSISAALDLATILKASQTLSGEIELEKLLSVLLHIVIENAGADKCVFMLLESERLLIQALAQLSLGVPSVESKRITHVDFYPRLLNPQPIEDSQDVPVGLINTVKRSLKPTVIIDATVHPQFINDPYIQQQQPKSILCSPISHQGKLLGILYLENNLTTGAFTSDRVELLNLLCAQAAISLVNARLYRNSQNYAQQLTQSLAKLQASEIRFQNLANNIPGMVYQFRLAADGSTSTPYVSSGCLELYGLEPELVMSGIHSLYAMNHPDDQPAIAQAIAYSAQTLTPFEREWRIILPSGTVKWIQSAARPERQADGAILWDGVVIDVSDVYDELRLRKQAELTLQQKSLDLQQALNDLQNAQLQIVQNEKMSALGNLVAGVAHEMNNPLGFIAASLKQAQPTVNDIVEHLKLYQESVPNASDQIINHAAEIDLDYSLEDLPKMIDSMSMACDRLKKISTSLRTFSRADQDYKVPFNIHQGIDSTILILKHRLKANELRPAIEVVTNYGNLPQIECFPGQLNQVFMNILANAIDALDESNPGRTLAEIQENPNQITITTSVENHLVKIAIADNGKGMSEEVKEKIFDHLFTTKIVGKGTGLGLAIARQIVEETHGGNLNCTSVLGQGTEFVITLSVKTVALDSSDFPHFIM